MSLEKIYKEPLVLLSFVLINCFLMNGSEGRRLPRKSRGHGRLMGASKSSRTSAKDMAAGWECLRAAGPQQFAHTARILSLHSPALHREVLRYCGLPGNHKIRINIYLYIFGRTQHTPKTANGYTRKETSRLTS